jgi:hypothetical protein
MHQKSFNFKHGGTYSNHYAINPYPANVDNMVSSYQR